MLDISDLTEDEKKELSYYNSLSKKEKNAYLEENHLIILGSDGEGYMKMDICPQYASMIEEYQKTHNLPSMDKAFEEIISKGIENAT